MFILGIIPARGGSKGIKHKNIIPLNGIPLIQYTIREALDSNLTSLVLTTDSEDIAKQYVPYKTIMRPPELAQDDTPTLPVIQHAIEPYKHIIDAIMILQPTSPLRTIDDINRAIVSFITHCKMFPETDSLVSVCEGVHPVKSYDAKGNPLLTQEPYDKHKHKCYTRNGAIFLLKKELLDEGRLIGDRPLLFEMPRSRSIDIDSWDDLMVAEAILKRGDLH